MHLNRTASTCPSLYGPGRHLVEIDIPDSDDPTFIWVRARPCHRATAAAATMIIIVLRARAIAQGNAPPGALPA